MRRRGLAIISVVLVLLVIQMIIVAIVIDSSRDHDLTVRRVETIAAFYAAEAGANMAVREVMEDSDEDGTGVIGEISDDGNPANDPVVGKGYVYVTSSVAGPETTLSSIGRSGRSTRQVDATYE